MFRTIESEGDKKRRRRTLHLQDFEQGLGKQLWCLLCNLTDTSTSSTLISAIVVGGQLGVVMYDSKLDLALMPPPPHHGVYWLNVATKKIITSGIVLLIHHRLFLNRPVKEHHTSCQSGVRDVLAVSNSLQHYLQLKEELYAPENFCSVPVEVGALPKLDGEERFCCPPPRRNRDSSLKRVTRRRHQMINRASSYNGANRHNDI